MIEIPEDFDSIFRYIVVVSQRAEQIINGAKPRSEGHQAKSTLVARNDVDEKLVEWRILSQEELDAQRQAIVDQFHAEIGAEGVAPEAGKIPDVLPTAGDTAEAAQAEAEPEEKDEELARLQRMLGISGNEAEPAQEEVVEEVSLSEAELDLDADDDVLDEEKD